MTDSVNHAIVLRNFSNSGQKIFVFDSQLGKIEFLANKINKAARLPNGAFIEYNLQQNGNYYKVSNINILELFPSNSYENFVFFHHILELCYCFLPLESNAINIFNLLSLFYFNPQLIKLEASRKIFLCKLLACLGFYPENELRYSSEFFSLISKPLDSKFDEKNQKKILLELNRWLIECIKSCECEQKLKTFEFIKKMDLGYE